MLRIGIIAGELSGDLLGAGLIAAVKKRFPDIHFEGIAGKHMREAGCVTWHNASELAVMGLTEVIKDLPRLLKIKKDVLKRWEDNPPDLFIGVDAPDFNLRVEKTLKQRGVKTMHYVSPSVWAWREGRVKKIEAAVDHLLCLLPFEPQYYENTKVKAHFIGHPMADSIPVDINARNFNQAIDSIQASDENDYKSLTQTVRIFTGETTKVNISSMGLKSGEKIQRKVALLPGSRSAEVKRLLPVFLEASLLLQEKYPDVVFQLPAANSHLQDYISQQVVKLAPTLKLDIRLGGVDEIFAYADAALMASGTATLEAMLYKCPMVVAYQLAPSTYKFLMLFNMLKTKYFSLPNILAKETLVPEVMQDEVETARLVKEISDILESPDNNSQLKQRFNELHLLLKQDTNEKVADVIQQVLALA